MPVMLTKQTSIDYDVHGEGSSLILINGLGFGRWAWFKQIPAFSRHFSTITFDVRGERALRNGVADLGAEVVKLLEHLGMEKAHVLGTSLGGVHCPGTSNRETGSRRSVGPCLYQLRR